MFFTLKKTDLGNKKKLGFGFKYPHWECVPPRYATAVHETTAEAFRLIVILWKHFKAKRRRQREREREKKYRMAERLRKWGKRDKS